ncbi:DUF4255 domain-containing protein [Seonamhaeicola sp.]|uniref:DUF4255 domain-containing protein n=1 Tax=Seonamhaeicola sp. TaxID=1912245 RepID=UPI002625C99B|nr:DUF4255 domain-containing protein [Seonamhaeicola sp.]
MIYEVLQVLTEEVNNYIEGAPVALDNIASIETDTSDTSASIDIVLTLLNLQEESTLKNISNYYVTDTKVTYKNPPVNINLFILFSANNSTYSESLKSLSRIIEFFQGKHVFTQDNTDFDRDVAGMEKLKNFKFIVDLYTPSFEELNYIWGTLGGKQYPSVLYKVTLVQIERDIVQSEGVVITQINPILNRN